MDITLIIKIILAITMILLFTFGLKLPDFEQK